MHVPGPHVAARSHMRGSKENAAINLATEKGLPVREVVAAVERVRGRGSRPREARRRAGDPPVLVARCSRAMELLNWSARQSNLETIVRTALRWQESLKLSEVLSEPAGARTPDRRAAVGPI